MRRHISKKTVCFFVGVMLMAGIAGCGSKADGDLPEIDIDTEVLEVADTEVSQEEESEVLGVDQATEKVAAYLEFSAFSYTGLIKQLEFDGFTTEDATYAADNCGADWNEQAGKKAQSYLDYAEFSKEELIEQLKYEGFTQEEAEFGVSKVGL